MFFLQYKTNFQDKQPTIQQKGGLFNEIQAAIFTLDICLGLHYIKWEN